MHLRYGGESNSQNSVAHLSDLKTQVVHVRAGQYQRAMYVLVSSTCLTSPALYIINQVLNLGGALVRSDSTDALGLGDSSTQPLGLPALGLGWHVCNLGSGTTQPRTLVSIP